MIDFLASRTGFDRDYFAREMESETSMRLVDALKSGLIHEITGLTRPCSQEWLSLASAMNGAVVGLPTHMMSENYMTACRAARTTANLRRMK